MMKAEKLHILITAPSLNHGKDRCGISSVIQTIIKNNEKYSYYQSFFPSALRKNHIDIVHQNFLFDPKGISREYIINQWCRLFRVPVVLHIHGGIVLMDKTSNNLVKKILKNSKAVIVQSSKEKEFLSRNYQYPDAFILENCVDVPLFAGIKKEKQSPSPVFLFMDRIHESKGLNELLEAFKLLKSDHLDFSFILCGDGPLRKSIVPQFESVLEERFQYLGVVSGRDKLDAIRGADYFLLPSWSEELPLPLLETMAAGLVPIVTNVGSVNFFVKNGENSIFVEQKNPQDLYQKMKALILNPDLYKAFSMNAKNTIAERYDIQDYIFQLNFIYEYLWIKR